MGNIRIIYLLTRICHYREIFSITAKISIKLRHKLKSVSNFNFYSLSSADLVEQSNIDYSRTHMLKSQAIYENFKSKPVHTKKMRHR